LDESHGEFELGRSGDVEKKLDDAKELLNIVPPVERGTLYGTKTVTPYWGRTLEDSLKDFQSFNEHAIGIAEFFTGLASKDVPQWFRSVGHAVQGLFAGNFLQTLRQEYDSLREAGKIKDDFRYSDQNQMCFTELLRYLEEEIPGKDRFELLKKIFLVTSTETVFNRDSHVPLQFMQIARGLTSGEILVLFAVYRNMGKGVNNQSDYIKLIIDESGLKYHELVMEQFEKLYSKKLLNNPNIIAGNNPIVIRDTMFTSLGRAFSDYVTKYDGLNSVE